MKITFRWRKDPEREARDVADALHYEWRFGRKYAAAKRYVITLLNDIWTGRRISFLVPVPVGALCYFWHNGVIYARSVKAYRVRTGNQIFADIYSPIDGRILHISEIYSSISECENHCPEKGVAADESRTTPEV